MNTSEQCNLPKGAYKSEFINSMHQTRLDKKPEFWHPQDETMKAPTFMTPQERKEKESLIGSKVVKSHDIWQSEAYESGEWKDWKYQSIYTKDYQKQYTNSHNYLDTTRPLNSTQRS